MISRKTLNEKLSLVRKQRDEHFSVYQQAIGAIGILEHLLSEIGDKDHITTEELEEMVGGKVESIDPL